MKNLRARIEAAVVARLTAAKTGTAIATSAIVPGQTDADLPDACVVAIAENSSGESRVLSALGNGVVRLRVIVRTNANDTAASTHQDMVEAVRLILTDESALRTAMSAQSVYLYAIHHDGSDEAMDGDRFVNSLNYELPVVDNPAA